MTQEVLIRVRIPDNAEISVEALPEGSSMDETSSKAPASISATPANSSVSASTDPAEAERYWRSLTENSRTLFGAMAEQQIEVGPFTYEDVAERLGVTREVLYSYKRNEGRGRNKWERDTGSKAPFELLEYGPVENRQIKRWCFPEGVAEVIISLSSAVSS